MFESLDDKIRWLLKLDLYGFELYKYLLDNNITVIKTDPLTIQVSDD